MIKTRQAVSAILALMAIGMAGCAASPEEIAQHMPIAIVNAEAGLGLKGYDPVAYFTDKAAVKGSEAYQANVKGVAWRFASVEHRAAFLADPEKFQPQYGGYCAFGMSNGVVVDADPEAWTVEGGRLFVNNNGIAHALWKRDRQTRIDDGDRNWDLLAKLPAR